MAKTLKTGNFSTDQLNQLVARIERLEEEKKALADDIKEVYAEAKAHGFDTVILRQVIRLRKMDKAELQEQQSLLDIYMDALGMTVDRSPSALEIATAEAADRIGVSDSVKDIAVRTARLVETDPHGAAAVVETVKSLTSKGERGAGLVGQIHDRLVEAGLQHQGGNQYRPPAADAATAEAEAAQ